MTCCTTLLKQNLPRTHLPPCPPAHPIPVPSLGLGCSIRMGFPMEGYQLYGCVCVSGLSVSVSPGPDGFHGQSTPQPAIQPALFWGTYMHLPILYNFSPYIRVGSVGISVGRVGTFVFVCRCGCLVGICATLYQIIRSSGPLSVSFLG